MALLALQTQSIAQVSSSSTTYSLAQDRNEGLSIKVTKPVRAKANVLRVVFPCKAEEATAEKAIARLAAHMTAVRTDLLVLGAVAESVQFAEIEPNLPNSLVQPNSYAAQQPVWQNAVPVQMPQANGNFLPQAFVAVAPNARPAVPNDLMKTLPRITTATTLVSAEWSLDGRANVDIATMKPKLLEAITSRKLDGKDLFHKFTPEQEDQIFEMTQIDIRNGDTRGLFSSPLQPPRFYFIGSIPDEVYNEALSAAFKTAEKQSQQIAKAGRFEIEKIDSVNVQVNAQSNIANNSIPMATRNVGYSSIDYGLDPLAWEPEIPVGAVRMNSLNQSQQNLILNVRFKIR